MNRFTVVISGEIADKPGQVANAAAIAVAGLRSDGFKQTILDPKGIPHAGIQWNMPILRTRRPTDFDKVCVNAQAAGLEISAFSKEAQMLSNNFEEYREYVTTNADLTLIALAIYGEDELVRRAVKFLSLL